MTNTWKLGAMVIFCFFYTKAIAQVSDFSRISGDSEISINQVKRLKNLVLAKAGEIKEIGQPRTVHKGAKPEIVMQGESIYFDSKKLKFGISLDSWKKLIGGSPRCYQDVVNWCVWDNYGLEVIGGDYGNKSVRAFSLYFQIEDVKNKPKPFGLSPAEIGDWLPHSPFQGYLEIDGYGIDGETKFSEMAHEVSGKRLLHCGLFDCSNPTGLFDRNAKIYLTLDGQSEHSSLKRFTIEVSDLK